MLKISVITVCYNAANLLTKTIESVLEQSYQSVQYIIVDGASGDTTQEVVNSYGARINHYLCEPDKGLYDAMNKGISLAKGDLIIFLNAGDYFVSKFALEFSISKMNLKDADLFFGRIVWNDLNSENIVLSDHNWVKYTWDLMASNFPHPATFYKKSLFDIIGCFNLNYSIAADYEWNVKALTLYRVKFQYINLIVSVFFTDGISNNFMYTDQKILEIEQINKSYFIPNNIHKAFVKRQNFIYLKFIKKIASKIYNCRLSRVY